ncbi:GNAT family N-acetyltransferase [Lachnospiraceae bacterium 54-53]
MKMWRVESERLILMPKSLEEMEQLYEAETEEEMKRAYGEMIVEMKRRPELEDWATDWTIELKDGRTVGGIGFKGAPDEHGTVEAGYDIHEEFRGQGYASEALGAMVEWCFKQPGVSCVRAQTEPDNLISQKVLKNNGFIQNGYGEEGPMFEVRRRIHGKAEGKGGIPLL